MEGNAQKFIFVIVVVAAVLFSHAIYPSFLPAEISSVGPARNSSSSNKLPMLILPSLTADVGASGSASSSSDTTSSVGTETSSFVRDGDANPPSLGVAVAAIADLKTGKFFLDDNVSTRWPLASVSKLMTAAVATDVLDPTQHITITEQMVAVDPSQQILKVGDTYTIADLLHVMLLPSNNVAAEALADFYGRDKFLAAMNAKAAEWGMSDTYYDDPSGLSAANESTADDLLLLAQHIYAGYPQVLAITRMPQATVYNLSTGQSVTIKSINNFAGQANFIGGKTGYTDQADGNLLSIFSYEGNPIVIIILGTNDGVRFTETQELLNWFENNFK